MIALLLLLLTTTCTECYTTRIVDQYGKVIVCEVCSELDSTSHQVVSHKFQCRPE